MRAKLARSFGVCAIAAKGDNRTADTKKPRIVSLEPLSRYGRILRFRIIANATNNIGPAAKYASQWEANSASGTPLVVSHGSGGCMPACIPSILTENTAPVARKPHTAARFKLQARFTE